MTDIEFQAWPKIARLNRNITITEKIDGTNAAVIIVKAEGDLNLALENVPEGATAVATDGVGAPDFEGSAVYYVAAQSRNRLITPESDNAGFAGWVRRNKHDLVDALGEGRHFGEWWGSGIQRKYGLTGPEKRFSLFNTSRHDPENFKLLKGQLRVVPVLYEGPYDNEQIDIALGDLITHGSVAEPGFMDPEGVVVFHSASRTMFKVTIEGDEAPKSLVA